ncbi:MAG: hypothetical protein OXG24_09730, partial [Gammaproteobacteria bacterium]|nr:hypothetical protein [Gammaproteobacteria bacterium]
GKRMKGKNHGRLVIVPVPSAARPTTSRHLERLDFFEHGPSITMSFDRQFLCRFTMFIVRYFIS